MSFLKLVSVITEQPRGIRRNQVAPESLSVPSQIAFRLSPTIESWTRSDKANFQAFLNHLAKLNEINTFQNFINVIRQCQREAREKAYRVVKCLAEKGIPDWIAPLFKASLSLAKPVESQLNLPDYRTHALAVPKAFQDCANIAIFCLDYEDYSLNSSMRRAIDHSYVFWTFTLGVGWGVQVVAAEVLALATAVPAAIIDGTINFGRWVEHSIREERHRLVGLPNHADFLRSLSVMDSSVAILGSTDFYLDVRIENYALFSRFVDVRIENQALFSRFIREGVNLTELKFLSTTPFRTCVRRFLNGRLDPLENTVMMAKVLISISESRGCEVLEENCSLFTRFITPISNVDHLKYLLTTRIPRVAMEYVSMLQDLESVVFVMKKMESISNLEVLTLFTRKARVSRFIKSDADTSFFEKSQFSQAFSEWDPALFSPPVLSFLKDRNDIFEKAVMMAKILTEINTTNDQKFRKENCTAFAYLITPDADIAQLAYLLTTPISKRTLEYIVTLNSITEKPINTVVIVFVVQKMEVISDQRALDLFCRKVPIAYFLHSNRKVLHFDENHFSQKLEEWVLASKEDRIRDAYFCTDPDIGYERLPEGEFIVKNKSEGHSYQPANIKFQIIMDNRYGDISGLKESVKYGWDEPWVSSLYPERYRGQKNLYVCLERAYCCAKGWEDGYHDPGEGAPVRVRRVVTEALSESGYKVTHTTYFRNSEGKKEEKVEIVHDDTRVEYKKGWAGGPFT